MLIQQYDVIDLIIWFLEALIAYKDLGGDIEAGTDISNRIELITGSILVI